MILHIGEPPLEVTNSVVSEIAQDEEKLLFRQTTMEKWFVTFFLPCYLNSSLQKTVATMETDLIGCFSILLLIENWIIDHIKHVMYVSEAALAKLAKSRINGFQVFKKSSF